MMRTRALIAFAAVLVVALAVWATRGRVVKGGAPAVVEAGAEASGCDDGGSGDRLRDGGQASAADLDGRCKVAPRSIVDANCDSSSGAHMSEKCRAGVVTAAKSGAPQAAVSVAVVAPAIAPVVKLSPELHSKLNEIARLDRKAFLSDDEKDFRTNLLKDETFLREISRVLTSHELDQTTKREQYQAIDALLAAQEIGSPVASTLLAGVVSDAQVENETIAKDVRANLAGIKAEVLYKWTSQDNTARPESLLPGPVSRQLWSNVQETQSRNEAESRTLGR